VLVRNKGRREEKREREEREKRERVACVVDVESEGSREKREEEDDANENIFIGRKRKSRRVKNEEGSLDSFGVCFLLSLLLKIK
jgi:hypothetical protein